jgi:hypothetical protein
MRGKLIMDVIMDGAWMLPYPQGFSHLKMIRKSMYPNTNTKNINCGIVSNQNYTFLLKYNELVAFMITPTVM